MRRRIVAEVSVSWHQTSTGQRFIGSIFEEAIAHNADRGFELESWQLERVAYRDAEDNTPIINETIIAVFVREGSEGGAERETDLEKSDDATG